MKVHIGSFLLARSLAGSAAEDMVVFSEDAALPGTWRAHSASVGYSHCSKDKDKRFLRLRFWERERLHTAMLNHDLLLCSVLSSYYDWRGAAECTVCVDGRNA